MHATPRTPACSRMSTSATCSRPTTWCSGVPSSSPNGGTSSRISTARAAPARRGSGRTASLRGKSPTRPPSGGTCSAAPPFDGAADRRRLRHCRGTAPEHRVERFAQVVSLDEILVARVVDGSVVDELAVTVEEEDLRRALRPACLRRRLILVVEVVEVEAEALGTRLHLVERVLRVAIGVVRADRDQPDPAVRVIALNLDHSAFPRLHVGAVVAGPDDGECGSVRVIVQ